MAGGDEQSLGAGRLFDGMSGRLRDDMGDEEDRLSALPDELIQLVLSFLHSGEAVRTCVLATRWRNLWKSVPSLCIDHRCYSQDFVNGLLRHRDPTPLDECEILIEDFRTDERDAERWLRYVVSCKVRDLTFHMLSCDRFPLSAGPLVSKHLTSLDLFRVGSKDFPVDISRCQSLEEVEIYQGVINIGNTGIHFPKSPFKIFTTGIGKLVDCFGPTPFLSMPSLVEALIGIGHDCGYSSRCTVCGSMKSVHCCYGIDVCVLLQGLSSATNLELLGLSSKIFRREINWCPMFNNLKTLVLGDWFMTANFSGLVCFLEHSPVLETLTLGLSKFSKKIKTSQIYKPKKQFVVSKHLKAVEIICCKGIAKIDQILNVLAYHGVQPELIYVAGEDYIGCFSCSST